MIQAAAMKTPGAHVARSTTTACGQPAQRLIITGTANAQNNNTEILLFREGNAMIILIYGFKLAVPLAEDETTLFKVCPQSSATTS
jgi:hypothetical protein